MNHAMFLSITAAFVLMLLAVIGWFLIRLVSQQDKAHDDNKKQFDSLLKKIDTLTVTLVDHTTDVAVIKNQIGFLNKAMADIQNLWTEFRTVHQKVVKLETKFDDFKQRGSDEAHH